jgi:hypothetical protein
VTHESSERESERGACKEEAKGGNVWEVVVGCYMTEGRGEAKTIFTRRPNINKKIKKI